MFLCQHRRHFLLTDRKTAARIYNRARKDVKLPGLMKTARPKQGMIISIRVRLGRAQLLISRTSLHLRLLESTALTIPCPPLLQARMTPAVVFAPWFAGENLR